MAVLPPQQPRQRFRILPGVVDAAHQTVLIGHPAAGFLKIIPAGIHDLPQGIGVGNGHQLFALLVVRGV